MLRFALFSLHDFQMGNVAGAQDSNAFVASMLEKLPMPHSSTLTYEGVFNEHFFHAGPPEMQHACAATCFPFVSEKSAWVAIWLKSFFDGAPRSPQPIELSVVIDVSGSMSCGMDDSRSNLADASRITYARKAVEILLRDCLRSDDCLALSTFNRQGTVLQPLTRLSDIDAEQCLEMVGQLQPGGGTTLSAGMDVGRGVFGTLQTGTAKRILFLTDMEDMSSLQLGEQIKQNAADGVYVSIMGMGVAFNSQLTDTVAKSKGSNYFCVTHEAQLQTCLREDFAFNFFPCAFEINMHIRAGSLTVKRVYGTAFETAERDDIDLRWTPQTDALYPEKTRQHINDLSQHLPMPLVGEVVSNMGPPKQSVTEINTLFPSRLREDGAMQGGLILVELEAVNEGPIGGRALQVSLSYEDAQGAAHHSMQLSIPDSASLYNTSDPAIQMSLLKGLVLQEYVQVCRKLMDLANEDTTIMELDIKKKHMQELKLAGEGIDSVVNTWMKKSVPLMDESMMAVVAKTFGSFAAKYKAVVAAIQGLSV